VEAEVSGFKESMRHGSLFSGIGGFDLAAEWMGWENVFHCEWNEFGKKVLNYYWPNAISYHDITKTDFTIHRGTIDILTGGFPCQPYSAAGKRLGKEDDRHIWPEMLRAIREIQPTFVVGENVRGLTNWNGGMVFDEVQADLEAEGYEVTPFLLPACAVNAPHRRDRIWFISRLISNASGTGCNGNKELAEGCNAKRNGISFNEFNALHESGIITDTESQRYEPFNPDRTAVIPTPTKQGLHGRSSNSIHQSTKWQEFPTQSPICNGDDGLSSRLDGITFPKWRNESIKAGGNAIVPQVAFEIFKAIQRTL
jgi:DNA (cytosine-5)-methyltransferase 1